jgi:hypothetical protein
LANESKRSTWVDGLHPKRKKEFHSLCLEQQKLVLGFPEKSRARALKTLDHDRRGLNGREHWVAGLDELRGLAADPNHLIKLAFQGRVGKVEAAVDILIDLKSGEHASVKNTDPSTYDLMAKASFLFDKHACDKIDLCAMATYFNKNPERRLLEGNYPSEDQIAQIFFTLQSGCELKNQRKM